MRGIIVGGACTLVLALVAGACGGRIAPDGWENDGGSPAATSSSGGSVGCASYGGSSSGPVGGPCSATEGDALCGVSAYRVDCPCPGPTCTCSRDGVVVATASSTSCSGAASGAPSGAPLDTTCPFPMDAWQACGFPQLP